MSANLHGLYIYLVIQIFFYTD